MRGAWQTNRGHSKSLNALAEQPVNQGQLRGEQEHAGRPGERLPKTQAGLARFAKPEADLQRADLDGVPVAQDHLLKLFAVDGGDGAAWDAR